MLAETQTSTFCQEPLRSQINCSQQLVLRIVIVIVGIVRIIAIIAILVITVAMIAISKNGNHVGLRSLRVHVVLDMPCSQNLKPKLETLRSYSLNSLKGVI